jgi:hypothetical protein
VAKVAIYPFNRLFETAMVDEDVQNGFCSVLRTPPRRWPLSECWYVNMGSVGRSFFRVDAMPNAGH